MGVAENVSYAAKNIPLYNSTVREFVGQIKPHLQQLAHFGELVTSCLLYPD